MDILQTQSLKHARMTNETLAKEVGRIEKVMSTFEQFTKQQLSEVRSELSGLASDTGKWQVNFEDMQARKIIEIHQAIKVLNQNYLFMQKDAKDKFEILNSQQKSNQDNIASRIGDLKKQLGKIFENQTNQGVITKQDPHFNAPVMAALSNLGSSAKEGSSSMELANFMNRVND